MTTVAKTFILPLLAVLVVGSAGTSSAASEAASGASLPQVQVGERLFLETRFAEFFFANSNGDENKKLKSGDPVVAKTQTTGKPLPGPFRGKSMNCAACHLEAELGKKSGGGVRSVCDFARRSPVPQLDDGRVSTARNSPTLVDTTLSRDVPQIFHLDGEFQTIEDLVVGTLTGRNFGWLPTETATATAHIVDVIRSDNGKNQLAKSFGGGGISYAKLFLGTDPSIPARLRLPAQYRLDVSTASDDQVLRGVASLIHAYLDSLRFSDTSPYDVFLRKNGLPRRADQGESGFSYSQRLLGLINQLSAPVFVTPKDGKFKLHPGQVFQFGPTELEGLKTFFSSNFPLQPHSGNCASCHTPPNFTDFKFHTVGTSQVEYDTIFGDGAFAAIDIPDLATRNADFNAYLPRSPNHPDATGRFRSAPSAANLGYTDLGVWNIVGNPDIPDPQGTLAQILCPQFGLNGPKCTPSAMLPLTIASFKTPTLRDLGQSNPYFHTGAMDSLDDVINFYIKVSGLARQNQLRNGDGSLTLMQIDNSDVAPLTAFLNSLNEDFQ